MRFLRLHFLELRNIRCYETARVDFKPGANIISGENGSGKSTLLIAIGFVLFGKKYLNNTGIEQHNLIRRGEAEGSIELGYETELGNFETKYILKVAGTNSWFLRDEKKRILTDTITETRQMIVDTLGGNIDQNIFKNALSASQGELAILLDAKPTPRKEQLHKILGIEEFRNTLLHVYRFKNKIQTMKEKYVDKTKILSENIEPVEKLEKELETLDQEKIVKELELNRTKSRITELTSTIKELQIQNAEIESLKVRIKELKKKGRELEEAIDKENNSLTSHQRKIGLTSSTDVSSHVKKLELEKEKLERIVEKLREKYTSCKSLMQQVEQKKADMESLERNQINNKKKLNDLLEGQTVNQLEVRLKHLDQEYTRMDILFRENHKQQESLEMLIKSLKAQSNDIVISINKFTTKMHEFTSTASKIPDLLSQNSQDLKTQQKIVEKHKNQFTSSNVQLGQISTEIKLHEDTITLLSNLSAETECPTCRQNLINTDVESLRNMHEDILKDLSVGHETLKMEVKQNSNRSMEAEKKARNLEEKQRRLREIQNKTSEYMENKTKHEQLLGELDNQKTKLVDLKQSIIKKDELDEIQMKKSSLTKRIAEVDKFIRLEQQLEVKVNQMKAVITDLEHQIKSKDFISIEEELKEKKGVYSRLNDEIRLCYTSILPTMRQLRNLESTLEKLKEEYLEVKQKRKKIEELFDPDQLSNLEAEQRRLQQDIGILGERIRQIEKESNKMNELLEREKKKTIDLEHISSELVKMNVALPRINKISNVLSDIPKRIMDKMSNTVSMELTETMRRMLPNRGFQKVIFSNEGEVTLSYLGEEIDRSTLSGGEKTVLGIGLRLALAEYVAPLKFLILDEPTQNLDAIRVSEFAEIIDRGSFFDDQGQILIVSHREGFNRNASRTVRIDVKASGKREIIIDEQE